MKSKLVLLSSLVIYSLTSFGQNTSNHWLTSVTTQEIVLFEINLEENTKPEEAFMNVEKKTKSLFIDIKGSLEKGRFKIQMYDPKGNKWKNDFIVDSRYDDEVFEFSHKKPITVPDSILDSKLPIPIMVGRLYLAIIRPKSGQWKVKIVPEKAIGNVQVSYYYRQ